ncbi:hypothetical protein ACTUQ0_15170, partial [Listeria monocytogenes]|uniref:hypothetical protein n=1 Tax=Listeria monocytogenes TaxID=1639 RepID=UPI003FA4475B
GGFVEPHYLGLHKPSHTAFQPETDMLADYQQLVNDLVADQDTVITAEVRDRAIEEASWRYSADRPHHIVADVTWPALSVFGP